jgi:DNA-binding MarR family transcriptional regulator
MNDRLGRRTLASGVGSGGIRRRLVVVAFTWHHCCVAGPAVSRAPDPEAVADAVILASQALVETSLGALRRCAPQLNLSEFRVLTVLHERGPLRLVDIAAALGVTSTTATRLADSLAAQHLVERIRQSNDRREIHLAIAAAGAGVVARVSSHRRSYVSSALEGLPVSIQNKALAMLRLLASPDSDVAAETA